MDEITNLLESADRLLQMAYYKALECEEKEAQKKILRAIKNIKAVM